MLCFDIGGITRAFDDLISMSQRDRCSANNISTLFLTNANQSDL